MNARIAASAITMLATLGGAAVWAQQASVTLTPAALKEIAEVEAEIDRIEAETLNRLSAPPWPLLWSVALLPFCIAPAVVSVFWRVSKFGGLRPAPVHVAGLIVAFLVPWPLCGRLALLSLWNLLLRSLLFICIALSCKR